MNYKILQNENLFEAFLGILPNCKPNEQYYVSLMARKKYIPNSSLTADKSQLKRFTATKDRLRQKIKQLECEVGTYQFDGMGIPQEALAIYITPNPRDLDKAGLHLLKAIADKVVKKESFNPKSLALNIIQTASSDRKWIDIDVDCFGDVTAAWIHFKHSVLRFINNDALTYIDTHGGFHVMIETAKIADEFKNKWYKGISDMDNELYDITMNGDNLVPIPGCCQGGFIPRILKHTHDI